MDSPFKCNVCKDKKVIALFTSTVPCECAERGDSTAQAPPRHPQIPADRTDALNDGWTLCHEPLYTHAPSNPIAVQCVIVKAFVSQPATLYVLRKWAEQTLWVPKSLKVMPATQRLYVYVYSGKSYIKTLPISKT